MLQEAAAYKKNWQKAQRARLKSGCVNDSYVYVHLNADDSLLHHVGMGYTSGRPWEMKNSRSSKHKNKVAKHGVRVELIADCLTLENALWWEVRWIKALKAVGYELTNLTDGGEGTKGLKHKPETIKLFSDLKKGKVGNRLGTTNTKETKDQISAAVTKLWTNEEYAQHMSDAHKGISLSDKSRKKLSVSMSVSRSEETEEQKEARRIKQVAGNTAAHARKTPEERSAIGKKAAQSRLRRYQYWGA